MFNGNSNWSADVRVWVRGNGQTLLGPGRVELLELIDQHRSISAAARAMGVSYRRAWKLVQLTNAAAGEPFVVAATGGPGGGGAELTPRGREALTAYRALAARLAKSADTAK